MVIPVARSTIDFASWFVSLGRLGFFMPQYTKPLKHSQGGLTRNLLDPLSSYFKLRHYLRGESVEKHEWVSYLSNPHEEET